MSQDKSESIDIEDIQLQNLMSEMMTQGVQAQKERAQRRESEEQTQNDQKEVQILDADKNESPLTEQSPPAEPASSGAVIEVKDAENLPPLFKAKSMTEAPDSIQNRFPNKHMGKMQKNNSSHPHHAFINALKPMPGAHHGLVLSDNSEILKVINMNKMQHQYIQNLQKANMTLKCKIKEISELHTEEDYMNYQDSQKKLVEEPENKAKEKSEEEEEEDLEIIEEAEELQLHEIGTIEEVSKKAQEKKRAMSKKRQERSKSRGPGRSKSRGPGRKNDFYDRNSIGRKQPKYEYQEKRSPGKPNYRDSNSNYKNNDRNDENDDRYYDERRNNDRRNYDSRDRRYQNYGVGGSGQPYHKNHHEKNYQGSRGKYYADKRDNEDYQRYDDDSSHHNQDSKYLDRYQRIKKYGPYDDQARYPEDYFEYQRRYSGAEDDLRRVDSRKSYGKNYDEFEEFENEKENRQHGHQRYQRERSEHRYFKYEDGHGVYEKDEELPPKKQAMIWGGSDKKNTSLTKFNKQSKDQNKSSGKKPRRPQKDERQNSPDHRDQDSRQQTAVPAVRQNSSPDRTKKDLRPAVFIKDLKKRSYKLEEEKAQYRGQNKFYQAKAPAPVVKQHQPVNHEVLSLQKAISSNDLKVLTDTIYEAKKNQSENKKESEKMKKTIQNAINQAETVLVELSSKEEVKR